MFRGVCVHHTYVKCKPAHFDGIYLSFSIRADFNHFLVNKEMGYGVLTDISADLPCFSHYVEEVLVILIGECFCKLSRTLPLTFILASVFDGFKRFLCFF